MNERYSELIDRINENGIESISDIFGDDMNIVFSFLSKKGLWDYIMWNSIDESYEDMALKSVIKYNPKKALEIITNNMGSLSFDGENYYCEVRSLSDLAELFEESRREIGSKGIAEFILKGDYDDFFYYQEDDVIQMIIYDLNDENKSYLQNYLIEKYGKQELKVEPKTKVLEELSEYKNDEYFLKITNDNISDLFDDDKTINYLFQNFFEVENDDLVNLYNNSYNEAYYNEYYDKVWNELKGTFIDLDAKPIEFKWGNKYYSKLKVTNVLPILIKEYLNDEYCSNILGFGDYFYFIDGGFACGAFEKLSFRYDDNPSWGYVKKAINDNFNSYF